MKYWLILGTVGVVCSGCTSVALERQTLNQSLSITDTRYQLVLDNLAVIVAEPSMIPSTPLITDGVTMVTDTATVNSNTVWDRVLKGFSKETLTLMGKRSPDLTWTLDTAADERVLSALQSAFLWLLCGPPDPRSYNSHILAEFRVFGDLKAMQAGWFHVGERQDVPCDACYKAHCKGRYVWVCHDGLKGLSEFTLVVLDILTTDETSLGARARAWI